MAFKIGDCFFFKEVKNIDKNNEEEGKRVFSENI